MAYIDLCAAQRCENYSPENDVVRLRPLNNSNRSFSFFFADELLPGRPSSIIRTGWKTPTSRQSNECRHEYTLQTRDVFVTAKLQTASADPWFDFSPPHRSLINRPPRRKVWLTPTTRCRAVTLPRRETSWNLQGCPKLVNRSQPLVGRSSPYCENMWRTYCCLISFFSDCRYVP